MHFLIFVIGSNPTANHPVAATFIKNAVQNGTKLIVCDPRRSDLARVAHRFMQFKPDLSSFGESTVLGGYSQPGDAPAPLPVRVNVFDACNVGVVLRAVLFVEAVVGVGAMVMFQVVVNINMTIGLGPITGIPLPWLSYGRSAMLVNFIALGLCASVARRGGQGVARW